jgi:RNA-binding protein YhbY
MRTLAPAARRALRARLTLFTPWWRSATNGLTRAVLHEIDVNLNAHELVKVRVFDDDRGERERLLTQICADLNAAPVQHLGKILTLWRPSPAPQAVAAVAKTRPAASSRPRRRATR